VCPLEIRITTQIEQRKKSLKKEETVEKEREKREAAIEAIKKICELAENKDAD
jgi:hypothetical protein